MIIKENFYTAVIRAALWGQKLPETTVREADWERYIPLWAAQGVGPLVFPMLFAHNEIAEAFTPALRMQMKMICAQTIQQHTRLHYTLEQAWQALTKAGIQPVLIKGAGLAALYPEPVNRAWGDIDLFVGKDQYHPACAVMRDTFPTALKFDEELDHYKHYNLIADGISIEVHRVSVALSHPRDERRYQTMEKAGMSQCKRLDLKGLEVNVPEPTFNALFVFLHSWEHVLSAGANIRQLCDLALLLHCYNGQIDRTRLAKDLRALRLLEPWRIYMYLLVHELGLPESEAPLYTPMVAKQAELLLPDMLEGHLIAPKSQTAAPHNRFARKLHTMRERMANARRIGAYSPVYARHMRESIIHSGLKRLFAKDRHWE